MPLKLKYSLLVALIIGVWCLHIYDRNKAIETAKTQIEAVYDKKLYEAALAANKVQSQMQTQADKEKEVKDAKIKDIDLKLAAAISELRKRPSRTENNPKDTSVAKACTGSSLYAEDAEFLTREAARADKILLERDYYYSQYESVRRILDEASNK
jgi:hypothetical protein